MTMGLGIRAKARAGRIARPYRRSLRDAGGYRYFRVVDVSVPVFEDEAPVELPTELLND